VINYQQCSTILINSRKLITINMNFDQLEIAITKQSYKPKHESPGPRKAENEMRCYGGCYSFNKARRKSQADHSKRQFTQSDGIQAKTCSGKDDCQCNSSAHDNISVMNVRQQQRCITSLSKGKNIYKNEWQLNKWHTECWKYSLRIFFTES